MLLKLKERHVFRHSNGTLDLPKGALVSAHHVGNGQSHVVLYHGPMKTVSMRKTDVYSLAEDVSPSGDEIISHSPEPGIPDVKPHLRTLSKTRTFRLGFSVMTCEKGSRIRIIQFDMRNKKVMVYFGLDGGHRMQDWFSQDDIYSSSDPVSD